MDLTKKFPRSPYVMISGIVMLPRTIDKCKADITRTIGEYHYGCPLDQGVFDFLGVNKEEFQKKVKELESEENIAGWIEGFNKSKKDKDNFNNKMRHSMPEDESSKKWLESEKKKLGKHDYFSYFDNLDADEKRF